MNNCHSQRGNVQLFRSVQA